MGERDPGGQYQSRVGKPVSLSRTVREHSFNEWAFPELKAVLDKGLPLLNVQFTLSAKQSLIDKSLGSVALPQELTHACLKAKGIVETKDQSVSLGDVETLTAVAIGIGERVQGDVMRQLKPIAQIGSG